MPIGVLEFFLSFPSVTFDVINLIHERLQILLSFHENFLNNF